MKKIILGSLFLSAFLFACDKANDTNSPDGMPSSEVIMLKEGTDPPPSKLGRSRDVIGEKVYCHNPGFTCREVGSVREADVAIIKSIIEETSAAHPIIFAANRSALISYFSKEMVDGVINNTLSVQVNGNLSGIAYFSFYQGGQFIQCAPLQQ